MIGTEGDAPGPPAAAPLAFHLLAKPTGSVCNLGCAYCFFLDKEQLYPGQASRMGDALLERYIRQLIVAHTTPEVTIAWQGGEPMLMGLEFFRRSVELARRHTRPGMTVQHTIQTNGTKINGDWAAFFKENRFLVGLSIDGPRELHDVYRRDKGGRPTFDRVMRGLAHLRERGVDWNALTAVHAANAGHPVEVYRFLRDDCGARFIQFIPIVERPNRAGVPYGDTVTERSVAAEQWGAFLIGVFEEWVRHDVGEVYVQMFDVALGNWYGEPAGLCVHSPTCGTALAMEFNGDVYACDHFVEPGWASLSPPRSRCASVTTSLPSSRAIASSATCASPATAAAPRTASSPPPTATPASTTSASASRPSSGTSTGRCDGCASCCGWAEPRRRSWRCMPTAADARREHDREER
jgi:uncharacterized protein